MSNPQGIPDPPLSQFLDPKGKPWPGKWNPGNCWATASSEAIRFATKGAVNPTPPEFRTKSGNTTRMAGFLGDIYAGARAYGIHEGVDDPYVASFKGYIGLPWDRFVAKLDNPQLCFVVATDYDQVPNNLSGDPSFDGNHSLTAFCGTLRDEGNGVRSVLIHDPIDGKARRYPLSVLQAAAQKIARAQGQPKGTIFATQFRQAIPHPPPPPPPPPPPADDPCADLRQAVDAANAALLIAQGAQATAEALDEAWIDYADQIAAIPRPDAPKEGTP